jgi:hypothetical protein
MVGEELVDSLERRGLTRREATILGASLDGLSEAEISKRFLISARHLPGIRQEALAKLAVTWEGDVSMTITLYGNEVMIGDYVLAHHYLDNGTLSEDRRNYEVTSITPFEGLEQWTEGGGEARTNPWRLSKKNLDMGRPSRNPRRDRAGSDG